jgi:molybdopterin converting factor small subunit
MTHSTVRIPTPLRAYTKGKDEVRVAGATVAEALANLGEQCPGLLDKVLDKDGKPRAFVNVYVGASVVRTMKGLATPIEDGAVLSIVPAVAGGAHGGSA